MVLSSTRGMVEALPERFRHCERDSDFAGSIAKILSERFSWLVYKAFAGSY